MYDYNIYSDFVSNLFATLESLYNWIYIPPQVSSNIHHTYKLLLGYFMN